MNASELRLQSAMVQGLAGDATAYQSFLKDLATHLRAYFRKRLVSLPDEVEDLVQETLLAVHNQRHTYQPDRPVTAWSYAIARYKLVDLFRRRAVSDSLNDPLDDESELFAAEESQACDARRDLGRLLDHLPERQKLPIMHVKLDGLSVAEAARLTGMSESAVKVGIHRGLRALALRIQEAT